MKLTVHNFLQLQDASKLLQLEDDLFMTYTGEKVNSTLEINYSFFIPVAMKEYEVVETFTKSVSKPEYIDLYKDEISEPLYTRYLNSKNAIEMFNEELNVNYIRFYTKEHI